MHSLTLILPTLDEVDSLEVILPELLAIDFIKQLLVVDDGSSDGTQRLVESFAARDPRVRLIARTAPRSLTASLQEGIDQATCDLVGWMDADGTMPARDLRGLVAAIDLGADVAVGSRFVAGGGLKGQVHQGFLGRARSLGAMHDTRDGAMGAAMSWVLNALLLPVLLGRPGARDWTSGFLVGRRSAMAPLRLRGDHGEYFLDLWVRAEARGLRVVEVPCRMRPRRAGRSKTGTTLADFLRRGVRYIGAALAVRQGHGLRTGSGGPIIVERPIDPSLPRPTPAVTREPLDGSPQTLR